MLIAFIFIRESFSKLYEINKQYRFTNKYGLYYPIVHHDPCYECIKKVEFNLETTELQMAEVDPFDLTTSIDNLTSSTTSMITTTATTITTTTATTVTRTLTELLNSTSANSTRPYYSSYNRDEVFNVSTFDITVKTC